MTARMTAVTRLRLVAGGEGDGRSLEYGVALPLAERLSGKFVPGDVVTLYDAQLALGERHESALATLSKLVVRGDFARLSQNVWVKLGADPDPYRVGARITFPYAFTGRTAFALHTCDASLPSEVVVMSLDSFEPFTFASVVYRCVQPWRPAEVIRLGTGERPAWREIAELDPSIPVPGPGERRPVVVRETVWVTDLQSTLRDCRSGRRRRPRRAAQPVAHNDPHQRIAETAGTVVWLPGGMASVG